MVGKREPYDYLVGSIEKFYNQEELSSLMKKNKFSKWNLEIYLMEFLLYTPGWKI